MRAAAVRGSPPDTATSITYESELWTMSPGPRLDFAERRQVEQVNGVEGSERER